MLNKTIQGGQFRTRTCIILLVYLHWYMFWCSTYLLADILVARNILLNTITLIVNVFVKNVRSKITGLSKQTGNKKEKSRANARLRLGSAFIAISKKERFVNHYIYSSLKFFPECITVVLFSVFLLIIFELLLILNVFVFKKVENIYQLTFSHVFPAKNDNFSILPNLHFFDSTR